MNPKDVLMLSKIPDSVDSDRVIIRRYVPGDGDAMYALAERNGNRDNLKGIADDIADLESVKHAEVKALKHRAEWAKRDRFVAGVWLKVDCSYVGELWIEPAKWDVPSFEIGWFIDKGHEGSGLVFEAARAGLNFIFEELKAHKAIVQTDDTNTRSFKLAERLGFRREGHTRESEIKDGQRFGRLIYGMLRDERS
ncbi:GNAT family N-acetyltransferase [Candidatus Bathyarchaeota archaeon]|jgi:ribosomal-protein-serine acetyltransferase|nr:GNAT family N-acetyltransferase [Candidatus Bathyarchaeota archaeon]MBT4319658.1 GNAT family N-acetyltransferase [Candidatus Bathyarchaeota archaeon]MBT4424659.1 GNAT family N-acetyltransferase [Candidatus Bathyarchaeota archaeon]MBT6604591.1 GNAT family N-acetyltransferase [Candidatus Bathyarchaeota archaeon]MBT7187360.1 GNAT family N-acetyltransferase [Candidatus Bathyarchaeota archaeon]